MAPFIAWAVIFFIMFMIIICCCAFEKKCPPCESWKRDFVKRPYERSELRCVTVFAIIFALAILVTTIVAFTFFPALEEDITMTKCSMYHSLDIALNGDQNNNWGGFQQMQDQIGNISTLLSTASAAISSTLSGNEWLQDGMNTLKTMNLDLYNNNKDSTVVSPKASDVASAISGNAALPTVQPLFVQQGLGPNGTANTMVTDIDLNMQIT